MENFKMYGCPGEGAGVGQPLYSNHCDLCLSQVRMSRSTWAILISEDGLIAELSLSQPAYVNH